MKADEPQEHDKDQEEDPEAYLVDAQSSEESDMDSDGMLDWSASVYKDYKDRIMATVACACPDSSMKPSDTWEWRGPCCLRLNASPKSGPKISLSLWSFFGQEKFACPWTGKTHFKVAPDACGKSVFRT